MGVYFKGYATLEYHIIRTGVVGYARRGTTTKRIGRGVQYTAIKLEKEYQDAWPME